ncbi:MAG: hypothetical protein FWF79_03265 [Defluviitaleaceae bacterium]|nr:hypothetical protein [Defluviitaleaceae bacterium]
MIVLYDLQEELKNIKAGELPENPYLCACGDTPSSLEVVEQDDAKTLLVKNRASVSDGISIKLPAYEGLCVGDRVTVTGRIGDGAPKTNWGIALNRSGNDYAHLAQHRIPTRDDLYYLTYLLEKVDLDCTLHIRTIFWGNEEACMNFYADDILITRNTHDTATDTDERSIVYSLATDESTEGFAPGVMTKYLVTSGEPMYKMIESEHGKAIHISNRVNDWDGLDIQLKPMGLKPGSNYTIRVEGRIDGHAPPEAMIMMQFLPGYVWRNPRAAYDNNEFVLTHNLSKTEVLNAEFIRITSNPPGAKMSFIISNIEIKVVE